MTSLSICVLQLHNAQRTARQAAQGAGFGSEPPYVIGPWSRFPALWLAGKETPTFHMQACYVSGSVTGGQSVCVFMYQRVSSVCYSVCSPPLLVVCSLLFSLSRCMLCTPLFSSLSLATDPVCLPPPNSLSRLFWQNLLFPDLLQALSLCITFFLFLWHKVAFLYHMISSVDLCGTVQKYLHIFWRSRVLACAKLTSLWWLGVASIEMFGVSKIIFYLINSFIYQGCIKLITRDSKDI